MIQKTWWDFYDEDPYEKIGRYAPDSFGNPIIVCLARISWAYLDWLDETYNRDEGKFFQDNHKIHDPLECGFDEWMEGAVSGVYLRMEKNGKPRPEWCPPAAPAQYMDM